MTKEKKYARIYLDHSYLETRMKYCFSSGQTEGSKAIIKQYVYKETLKYRLGQGIEMKDLFF